MDRERDGDVWRARVPASELPRDDLLRLSRVGPELAVRRRVDSRARRPGFIADVDADGNRMNPNKLLFDPYARELSHDPTTPDAARRLDLRDRRRDRAKDSAPVAPKGIVLRDEPRRRRRQAAARAAPTTSSTRSTCAASRWPTPVDVRGHLRGRRASGGVPAPSSASPRSSSCPCRRRRTTATTSIPTSASGDNYWGYSTLAYFAPDRRYACDRSPGGPTREFRAMVRAFHDARHQGLHRRRLQPHRRGRRRLAALAARPRQRRLLPARSRGHRLHELATASAPTSPTRQAARARDLILDSLALLARRARRRRLPLRPRADPRQRVRPELLHVRSRRSRADRRRLARPRDGGDGADLIAEPWGVGAGTLPGRQLPGGLVGVERQLPRPRSARTRTSSASPTVTPGWLAARVARLVGAVPRRRPPPVGARSTSSSRTTASRCATSTRATARTTSRRGRTARPTAARDDNMSWDHGGDAGRAAPGGAHRPRAR